MAFKLNIAHEGKTLKMESDSESLVGVKIGDRVGGEAISPELAGYEIEITGTSDKAGFPGLKEHAGPGLRKALLTYGKGMHKRPRKEGKKPVPSPKGLRLRKTIRGNEISQDTVQINVKVIKQGNKKFEDFFISAEVNPEQVEEKKVEEKKE
jgi:small subunit ribosomal protein S6e